MQDQENVIVKWSSYGKKKFLKLEISLKSGEPEIVSFLIFPTRFNEYSIYLHRLLDAQSVIMNASTQN
jgi:hypothetical protein